MNRTIDRRTLLQAGGALVVAFRLPLSRTEASPAAGTKTLSPDRVDGFLAIAPDSRVTVYSGKVDLGTGVRTALTQIVAEELDVPLERVSVVMGDTALTVNQGGASGSTGVQKGGIALRNAAVEARVRAGVAELTRRFPIY